MVCSDIETEFEKLNIAQEQCEATKCLYIKFVNIIDETKRKKEAVKILKTVASNNEFFCNVEKWLCQKLESKDAGISKKVSALLELSATTRDIVNRNFKRVCTYLVHVLSILCDEETSKKKFSNSEKFNECAMQSVKLCLKLIQFLRERVSDVISSKDLDVENIGLVELILGHLLTVLSCKRFTKECSLLTGTAIALLFSLCEKNKETLVSIMSLLDYLGGESSMQSCKLGSVVIKYPQVTPSLYSPLLLLNGFVSISSNILLEKYSNDELLLDSMFKLIDVNRYKDSVSKYLCFQTLHAWMNYLNSISMDTLVTFHKGRSLFLQNDSGYCNQILDWVWMHIEDLVDGVPCIVQKIFALLLKLHKEEKRSNESNSHSSKDQFYVELAEDILKQSWHVKGRWSLLAELIPFVTFKQLFQQKTHLADEMIQCMTTCGLASISNEVYQAILKDMKKYSDDDPAIAIEDWSSIFSKSIMNALQSNNILLRQNIGQYWIPSTVRILPACLLQTEGEMRLKLSDGKQMNTSLLHAYILVIKGCRSFALIKSDRIEECKDLLSKALQHSDLEVRIETFNTLCCNPKKTEPLPVSFQELILDFVKDNLNNDSSRFRQQMLSSLKKLLISIRDSSVMLHRRFLSEEKKGNSDEVSKNLLMKLIDFVESLLAITKSCLHPGAHFQRKKTGLLLFQLLSELFVFVKDGGKRKKGAATEAAKSLFNFICDERCGLGMSKWNILSSMNTELLSCVEDQHDEIRDLAFEILNYHQLLSDDHLLSVKKTFDATMNIALSLLDSPKCHEAESGAIIMKFIFNRLVENKSVARHLSSFHFCDQQLLGDEVDAADMALCYLLLNRGYCYLDKARNDFLLASCYHPIYGIILAFSQILNSLAKYPSCPGLAAFVKQLVKFCDSISSMTVQLLAGTYVGKNISGNDCTEASPSFADIDKALDITLKHCPSYSQMKETMGHFHCRELLVSFCWLNMKAISFVLISIGNLMVSASKENLFLDMETLQLIYNYYRNSLIKCRHKGVIEGSLSSLTCFSKCLSSTNLYWIEMSTWCWDVLNSAVDLSQNASVTKRSAGIPMFIQAILSAEPPAENGKLLHKCMRYLLDIAKTELPEDININVDLPQCNAINIMRAIFRDANLGNSVLLYVEDAVTLTINGFSSPSWSIRNASTILLGALVPRMLGQRVSQEENSVQKTNTVDVFFFRYPKLVSYFLTCLQSQKSECMESDMSESVGYGANCIAPHVVPALTFLSKLSSSHGAEGFRLSSTFYPILSYFMASPVFTIRELATTSIIAFTPEEEYTKLVNDMLSTFVNEHNNNKIHSLFMIFLKTINLSKSNRLSLCTTIIEQYKKGALFSTVKCDLWSLGVALDILVECYYTLKSDALLTLIEYVKCKLSFTELLTSVRVGKPRYLKSLSKAVVILLCEDDLKEQAHEIMCRIESTSCKDLHVCFFKLVNQYMASIQESVVSKIFIFSVKTILESDCRILLEASIACFNLLVTERTIQEVANKRELLNRLLELLKTSLRLLPFLLPSIEKLLHYTQQLHEDKHLIVGTDTTCQNEDDVYMSIIDTVVHLVEKFSCPEEGEDFRCASAMSLRLLQQLFMAYGIHGDKPILKRSVLRVLTSAVRLLQDEDDMVRQEANSHLTFVHVLMARDFRIGENHEMKGYCDDNVNHQNDIQCNITLKALIKYVELNALREEICFSWLVDTFVRSDPGDFNISCDLMLFEQEASNLYAEEIIIIDMVFESLETVLTTLSSDPIAVQRFYLYSNIFKDTARVVCKKDVDWLKCKQANDSRYLMMSIYGLFGGRKSYITMYKMLKWLLLLRLCVTVNERKEIKELYVNELVSVVGKYSLHPILNENYDKVVRKYHVI